MWRARRVGMEAGASGGPTGTLTTDNRWPKEEKRESNLSAPGSCFGDGPTGETQAGRRSFMPQLRTPSSQSSLLLPSSTYDHPRVRSPPIVVGGKRNHAPVVANQAACR